jgi:hypothetical protein
MVSAFMGGGVFGSPRPAGGQRPADNVAEPPLGVVIAGRHVDDSCKD